MGINEVTKRVVGKSTQIHRNEGACKTRRKDEGESRAPREAGAMLKKHRRSELQRGLSEQQPAPNTERDEDSWI